MRNYNCIYRNLLQEKTKKISQVAPIQPESLDDSVTRPIRRQKTTIEEGLKLEGAVVFEALYKAIKTKLVTSIVLSVLNQVIKLGTPLSMGKVLKNIT